MQKKIVSNFVAEVSPALFAVAHLRALALFSGELSYSPFLPSQLGGTATMSLNFVAGMHFVYQLGASIRTLDNSGRLAVM